MAFGQAGAASTRSIVNRVVGTERDGQFAELCTATIRAVAQGVRRLALIQAIVVGRVLPIAGVPIPSVLAVIVLMLGVAQVPALLVTLPAIDYFWSSGDHCTGAAVAYTVLLFVAGMPENVLTPLMPGQ